MVNYKIIDNQVVEVQTGNIMSNTPNKEMCRHLNFGGGFDGHTPAFFFDKFKKSSYQTEELV